MHVLQVLLVCLGAWLGSARSLSSLESTRDGSKTSAQETTRIVTATISYTPTATFGNACAQVSQSLAEYALASPSATIPAYIPAEVAYNCFASVPLVTEDATKLIDGVVAMLQFQSDLTFKKDPPPTYPHPGIDILRELHELRRLVKTGKITSEAIFEGRVASILARGYDGHLFYNLDGLSGFVYTRSRLLSLVSISKDGDAPPEIYLHEDVVAYVNGSITELVPIVSINGQPAASAVQSEALNAATTSLQDIDALYNSYFFQHNLQGDFYQFSGIFQSVAGLTYPGPSTTISFANGTNTTLRNSAITELNFTDVTDGQTFYNKFIAVKPESNHTSSAPPSSTSTPPAVTHLRGYPSPVAISRDGSASGYFLDGTGLNDVAVLALTKFTETAGESFQDTVRNFFDLCHSSGKRRLVMDVSGNPGGSVVLAYSVFKLLFPNIDPYGAGSFRAHEGLNILGEFYSNASVSGNPDNTTEFFYNGGYSSFSAYDYLNASGAPFTSWSEFYGPLQAHGDNFTTLSRLNYSNAEFNQLRYMLNPFGYGNNTDTGTQPFETKDIILMSDGQCSSTCTILSHFLKYQGKVKSVSIGGRPQTGPMQAVGGIKGSQAYTFDILYGDVNTGYESDSDFASKAKGTSIETIYNLGDYLLARTAGKGKTPSQIGFNLKNNIAEGDTTLTPLQYVYEAADCRLWNQAEFVANVSASWAFVAQQAFGLNNTSVFSKCVEGSTNDPSSLSGNASLYNNGIPTNVTTSPINDGTGPGPYQGAAYRSTPLTMSAVTFSLLVYLVLVS